MLAPAPNPLRHLACSWLYHRRSQPPSGKTLSELAINLLEIVAPSLLSVASQPTRRQRGFDSEEHSNDTHASTTAWHYKKGKPRKPSFASWCTR